MAARNRKNPDLPMTAEVFRTTLDRLVANVAQVIKGKEEAIRLSLTALMAGGNILLEDVPGTGKTMLSRAVARSIDATVRRIQCTPDLLPGDITGSPVLDRKTGEFVFRPGPVFANIVLVDEINRATPKTQSALLEAMQERTVTVDSVTHEVPRPFLVVATQNPVELAGTFPLPEAQLDRFLFKLRLGYPDRQAEAEVLVVNRQQEAIDQLGPVVDTDTVLAMIAWASGVTVQEPLVLYAVDIVRATREDASVQLGASTRAAMALQRAAQVFAAADGREDVHPEDVKRAALPVLLHRVLLSPDAQLRGETVDDVVARVLARVKVPMGLAAPSAG